MTALRQRMIEDLQLHGLAVKTQQAYVGAVQQLAEHYGKSPDKLGEEQIRDYFLYLKDDKKCSRSSATIALCAIKFLFEKTLKRPWGVFDLVRPKKQYKYPVILSGDEVRKILAHVKLPHYRVCLATIYSCGLRLQEGASLKVSNIDAARMVVHVEQGKGAKDRYVALPKATLHLLRDFWKTHRNRQWIFPAPGPGSNGRSSATKSMAACGIQRAFQQALKKSGIKKKASVHSLRHAYANHLLEDGVNLRLIQEFLGHRSARTTQVYTHLTAKIEAMAQETINRLMNDLEGPGGHRHD